VLVLLGREAALLHHVLELHEGLGLAVHDGHDLGPLHVAHLHVDQGEAGVLDLLVQLLEELPGLALVGLHDLVLAGHEVLALEERGTSVFRWSRNEFTSLRKSRPCPAGKRNSTGDSGFLKLFT
jgi:hypothetical protein